MTVNKFCTHSFACFRCCALRCTHKCFTNFVHSCAQWGLKVRFFVCVHELIDGSELCCDKRRPWTCRCETIWSFRAGQTLPVVCFWLAAFPLGPIFFFSFLLFLQRSCYARTSVCLCACGSCQTLAGLEYVQHCLKFDWDVRLILTQRASINTELARTVRAHTHAHNIIRNYFLCPPMYRSSLPLAPGEKKNPGAVPKCTVWIFRVPQNMSTATKCVRKEQGKETGAALKMNASRACFASCSTRGWWNIHVITMFKFFFLV